MMEDIFANMIIPSLITGVAFFGIGSILNFSPPGEVNGFIGYRTNSSMKSQERWDFAQKYSSRHMMFSGLIMAFISLLGYFLPIDVESKQILGIGLVLASAAIMIISTERAIKKRFKDE